MDAQEFYHLRSMSGEDWERVRKEYDYWIRNVQLTGARFWIGVTVAGIPTAYFFQGWLKFLGFLMVLMALCESAKRKGNWEGYVDGFAAGRDEGIEKALGLTAEEAAEAWDLGIEMEIDERTISAFDKRNAKQAGSTPT